MTDEPQRHRIQVACPECGHLQNEPALVVSTQCRACRTNFQVRDGKGVTRHSPVARLAKPRRETDPEPTPAPATPKPSPRYGPSGPPRRPLLLRLFRPAKPPREVVCFGCGHSFKAIAEAQSSQCPKCGGYVNLLDHEVTEHSNTRIETRGNVIIRKTGSISAATIRCHHLTVLGGLAADVDCSGDLVIRSSGKVSGTIRCRQLRVEKGARVEFLQPVTAATATIDGQVRGQISSTGPVTLEKGAQLFGLVRTSELIVKPRAKHTGTVELTGTTTQPSPGKP
jgi:cytoskeletal protein CcmA (bactofilin family)/Zn finger protein HypA/HybF involved in hydrogenase expression